MQYQALYRKYRPSSFDDVVGQDAIIKTIKNAIKENKISHAYLFCGPRGTGKTSVAKLVARNINCENNNDGNACGKCNFCKQFDNKENQDIIEIDAASNNGIDEIREIKNKINFIPNAGKYKIYIIDEVHMLSIGAFNALLKTLEEPPAHIIFILATTEVQKVPLTIISRCQRFDFKKITNEMIEKRIYHVVNKENIDIEESAIKEISRLSDGGLRDAIGLLDQLVSFSNKKINSDDVHNISGTISKKEIVDLLENCFEGNINIVFNDIDNYNQRGKDLIKLSEELLMTLRDVLIVKNISNYFESDKYLNDLYCKNTKKFDEKIIYEWIIELNNTINNMRSSNHPKILLETMIIKLYKKEITSSDCDKKINDLDYDPKPEKVRSVKIETKIKLDDDNVKIEQESKKDIDIDFVNVRINNALATADKNILSDLRARWLNIATYSLDPYFGPLAGILLDAEIRAAGELYLLIAYKYDSMVERFNEVIEEIELLLEKVFNKKYKVIAIDNSSWEKIKKDYVNTTKAGKKYQIMNDMPIKQKNKIIKNDTLEDDLIKSAINIFGDNIVEIK